MNRLDRYFFKEVAAPTLVAFGAYTGLMLIRGLFQVSNLVLQSEEPLREAASVLLLSVPHIVVLTIPVSLLLGILVGTARLSGDSELIALRAAGMDLLRLYRPVGLLAAAATATTLWVMLALLPAANRNLADKRLALSAFAVSQRIQPGVFTPELLGRSIYVESASADRRELAGLVVADRSNPADGERLTLAAHGSLELDPRAGELWIRLDDAVTYHVSPTDPSRLDRSTFSTQKILLASVRPPSAADRDVREMNLVQLAQRWRAGPSDLDRRSALLEAHKKFALPAACLVFGLIGIPLGVFNRRGGRAGGFAVSMAIVLGYYVLLASGEARVQEGGFEPALAMWLPNLLLAGFGAWAVHRVRHDRPILGRLPFALPRVFRRSPEAGARGARRSVAASFLLDRYVAARFLRTFLLVVFSVVLLYLVIDYFDISDEIAEYRIPVGIVLGYLQAKLAPVLVDVVPFSFLIAALVTTAGLVKANETVAMLAHGFSLLRATAVLPLLAVVTGLLLFVFADRVVPSAAREAERLKNRIMNRHDDPSSGGSFAWFRGEEGRFYSVETYDSGTRSAENVAIIQIRPGTSRLLLRAEGRRAEFVPQRGVFLEDGWTRDFDETGGSLFLRRKDRFFVEGREAAAAVGAGRSDPREMTVSQLARFVRARKRAGAPTGAYETGLHFKIATVPATVLLTYLGLPFALRHGKRGAVAGIGVAILVGLGFFFVEQMFLKFGETGSLPPAVAAWSGSVIFAIAAAWGLLDVRT